MYRDVFDLKGRGLGTLKLIIKGQLIKTHYNDSDDNRKNVTIQLSNYLVVKSIRCNVCEIQWQPSSPLQTLYGHTDKAIHYTINDSSVLSLLRHTLPPPEW